MIYHNTIDLIGSYKCSNRVRKCSINLMLILELNKNQNSVCSSTRKVDDWGPLEKIEYFRDKYIKSSHVFIGILGKTAGQNRCLIYTACVVNIFNQDISDRIKNINEK